MISVSMKELLEAGVHFGHQTKRWNPKMKEYIFGKRNGIYIINLQKTLRQFQAAISFVIRLGTEGKQILFVGTKRQAQDAIAEEATRCGMHYVNERWLGGLLTNFKTIKRRIDRLRKLEEMTAAGEAVGYTKKEFARLLREKAKLDRVLSGIKRVERLPDALFIVDPKKEQIAVSEARKLGVPVIAIVDTNCDPNEVDYPVPGNDDAIRAIRLFASRVADAVLEGSNLRMKQAGDGPSTEDSGTSAANCRHPTWGSSQAAWLAPARSVAWSLPAQPVDIESIEEPSGCRSPPTWSVT